MYFSFIRTLFGKIDMKIINEKLNYLKELVFESDNTACFIEREKFLNNLDTSVYNVESLNYHANILAGMLDNVSVPVDENDIFVGRVVEGVLDSFEGVPNRTLKSNGHMSPEYARLWQKGYKGILADIKKNAEQRSDEKSMVFYENARIVVEAIRRYSKRYADAARSKGLTRAADALERVPYEPAYDLYSALQGAWIVHLIASCYVGARDYAFGRLDQSLYPYYLKELANGTTKEEIEDILAGFFIKTNEICGRTSWNYKRKPILCNSSKQYVNIGGENPNELSFAILAAAKKVNMAQPQIVVLLDPGANEEFTDATFEALTVLTDKMNVYSYTSVKSFLLEKGLSEEIASDFTYSACCTFDLNHRNIREEYFLPSVQTFCNVIYEKDFDNINEIVEAYFDALRENLLEHLDLVQQKVSFTKNRKAFVLDALLIGDCTEKCRYPLNGGLTYHVYNVFFSGIATVADSLAAIDKLVFEEKRFTYREFIDIVKSNYQGNDDVLAFVTSLPKYGNDLSVDKYAAMVGEAFVSMVNSISLPKGKYAIPGFYSLDKDNRWAKDIPATPDGRLWGDPFSENQSPTYGADRNGITSLINSVSKLPLEKTATGGFNLTFSGSVKPETLKALITTFFEKGGLHVGISVLSREELEDAMNNPDKYKSLTVRLYGFSEYFINMPEWQQRAILNRTAY